MPDDPARILIVDACLAITFGNRDRLDLIVGLRRYDRVIIGGRSLSEVTQDPARAALSRMIDEGAAAVESIDLDDPAEQAELARLDNAPAFRGRGDAEVLALASARRYAVGTDDEAVKRAARAELGRARVVTTLDVFLLQIQEGQLDDEEAERVLGELDSGNAILKRLEQAGKTLSDLIPDRS